MTNFDDDEAIDNEKLDALEEAASRLKEDGEAVAALICSQAIKLWTTGIFPDGTKCKRDTTRKDALKLAMGLVGMGDNREDYRVHFVLDAKVDDPRVTEEEVGDMFGDGTDVRIR